MLQGLLTSIRKRILDIPAFVVFILALGITILFSYLAYQRTIEDDAVRFARVENRFKESLEGRFQVYINALIHTRSFVTTAKPWTRAKFRQFVHGVNLQRSYPGLLGIGYVEKIPPGQLKSHERKVRREGYPEYKVWPEGHRPYYTAIVALEPFTKTNQRAFGFDMMSEEARREAMEQARDTGEPTITRKIVLVQETEAPSSQPKYLYGFIVFVPIFKEGLPTETVEQRRKALTGYISGPFRARELLSRVLTEEDFISERVTFQVFDGEGTQPDQKVFQPNIKYPEMTGFRGPLPQPRTLTLEIANRKWTAVLEPLPHFRIPSSRDTPWQIFLLGIAISSLLYFFARYASRHANAIAQSERQMRLIADTLPVLISYVDRQGIYRFSNSAYKEWFGKSPDEISGQTVEAVLGKEGSERSALLRDKAFQGERQSGEVSMSHPTLGNRKVHVEYLPDVHKDGVVAGVVVLATDITERKISEERLREQSRILGVVNKVGLSLRAEVELGKIVQIVTDSATELTNAKFGAFFYNIPDGSGRNYTLYSISGVPREKFSKFPMPRNTKIFGPTFTGQGIIRSGDITKHKDFGKNPPYNGMPPGHLPVKSYMAVPVISRSGEVLGGLFFGHPETDIFTEKAERMVAGIAAQAAVAIDNSRLVSELKSGEKRYKNLASQQAFLAKAGEVLGSSLDFKKILTQLAQIAVPEVADWCIVHIINRDGKIEVVAATHTDPEKMKWAEQVGKKYPVNAKSSRGVGTVIRTGEPELVSEVTDEILREGSQAPDQAEILKSMDLKSYICIPMKARDQVFGAITLVTAESGRVYTQNDLQFAEDLARRASVAVDNAKLYAEAQNINRVKDEFLATLSHELRTPLNVILGHAEILKSESEGLSSEIESSLDAIYRNAKAQNQIIGDLLDISAIITGKISFNPNVLAVNEIVQSAVESIRFTAESKGVLLEYSFAAEGCQISGDPVRIQQIIWNLLSNAVKFTPKGGKVQVSTFADNSQCVIEVKDTGKGIEPQFLPYVFDRFRQEDNSMTRSFGGLGLGLSIVRQLVEMHGGQITVQSQGRGKGSVFTVRIPVKAVHEFASSEAKLKTTDSAHRLQGLDILVVDDEADARQLVEKILRRNGAHVQVTSSSHEALQQYKRKKPDLIVSDIGMPIEDGYAFLRQLRLFETSAGIFTPAIALSAYARDEDRARSLAAGFQEHLSKPVETQALVQTLVNIIAR